MTNQGPKLMSEAEKIAGSLNEAQRAAFARSADEDMHPTNAGRISTYGDLNVARQLFDLGLIERISTFSFATPLGLEVRRILEQSK